MPPAASEARRLTFRVSRFFRKPFPPGLKKSHARGGVDSLHLGVGFVLWSLGMGKRSGKGL